MRYEKSVLSVLCALGLLAAAAGAQAEGRCEPNKAVKFVGLNWESGTLFTKLMQFVLAKSYGCATDSLSGNSITMEQTLSTNGIRVFVGGQIDRNDAWNKAVATGKVVGVDEPIVGAVEGWYVPRYVIGGDPQHRLEAKAPKLRSIVNLAQYAEIFHDPEEPSRGHFYNCPADWACELESSEMLKNYGLEGMLTNFRPGTGPTLDAAVPSSYRRGESILFYYWSPTPLMGYAGLVHLEERPGVDKCIRIQAGLLQTFHDQASELVAVLEKVNLPAELLNNDLARMAKDRIDAVRLARELLEEHPEAWHTWVDEDVAKEIEAAL